MTTSNRQRICGVVLAGGQGTRMGGQDKGLLFLGGKPLVSWLIDSLRKQTDTLLISANRNFTDYRQFGYPIIKDGYDGYEGPLAGILGCMEKTDAELLLCMPCDCLFPADDLAKQLYRGLTESEADICIAEINGKPEPLFALLKTSLLDSLREYMQRGERKTIKWYRENRLALVDYSNRPEAFININTKEDARLALIAGCQL